jgi:hypothetical protein
VPRIIPTLGLIGAPLILASSTAILFGIDHAGSVWQGIATAPIFVWELSLGVWLAVEHTAGPIKGPAVSSLWAR